MEKRKKFEVLVTQLNRFSRKFVVDAANPLAGKATVKGMIAAQPMDARKGTYAGNELIMSKRGSPSRRCSFNLVRADDLRS